MTNAMYMGVRYVWSEYSVGPTLYINYSTYTYEWHDVTNEILHWEEISPVVLQDKYCFSGYDYNIWNN